MNICLIVVRIGLENAMNCSHVRHVPDQLHN